MLVMASLASMVDASRLGAAAFPWDARVRGMDAALLAHDIKAAEWAWARGLSRRIGQPDVGGDAGSGGRPIAESARPRTDGRSPPRRPARLTLAALFRTRSQGATDGVLVAQAFADLGDRQVVEQCLQIAAGLATQSGDGAALARPDSFCVSRRSRGRPKDLGPRP